MIAKNAAYKKIRLENIKMKELDNTPKSVMVEKFSKPKYCNLPNYLPSREVSEDDASSSSHIKELQLLKKKKEKDISRITELMDKTFHNRRQMLVGESNEDRKSVREIVEIFPFLTDKHEVGLWSNMNY